MPSRWPQTTALLALLVTPRPGLCADVVDWAPPESLVSVVFRGANSAAELIDLVERRFGGIANVDLAVKRLRAIEPVAGLRPFSRQWQKGLAPGRGVGVFAAGTGKLRFVIGADDSAAALASLQANVEATGVAVTRRPDGFDADGASFMCALREGFLICDQGTTPVPDLAPGRPGYLDNGPFAPDGLLFVHVRGEILRAMTDGEEVLTDGWFELRHEAGRFETNAVFRVQPMLTGPLGMLLAKGGRTIGLDLVDAESGALVKLSFDTATLLGGVENLSGGQIPASARPLFDALAAHWSGDIIVTGDGGLMHPVLIIGLKSPEGGQKLVDAVVAALKSEGVDVLVGKGPLRPGLKTLQITVDAKVILHQHYQVVGDALVLALTPADVQRRVDGRVKPMKVPDHFAEKGVHGFVTGPLPFTFAIPWLNEIASGYLDWKAIDWYADAHVVMGVVALLFEEVGFEWSPEADKQRISAWWSFL